MLSLIGGAIGIVFGMGASYIITQDPGLGGADLSARDRNSGGVLHGSGDILRLLPRAKSSTPESNRGVTLRVGASSESAIPKNSNRREGEAGTVHSAR